MPVRKLPEDYRCLAESRGYKWLGPEVEKSTLNTWWLCANGHRWEATYANIRSGHGCHECGKQSSIENRRKSPSDYHDLAESRGYKWLGPEVANANGDYTYWLCPNGHRYKSTYSNFVQGYGCRECGSIRTGDAIRKCVDDYHALAESKDFEWLGTEVVSSSTPTLWGCSCGHKWIESYSKIKSRCVCPDCHKLEVGRRTLNRPVGLANRNRHTSSDYRALAESIGYKWLGPEVSSANQKTLWLCSSGHEWFGSYNNLSGGKGCRICGFARVANKNRLTRKDYHDLAKSKDLLWSGEEVKHNVDYTAWMCRKCGLQFENSYANISSNLSGCPSCCFGYVNGVATSKPQRDLCEMIGGKLNHKFDRYVIDIAFPEYMVAVEYDCWHWHKDKLRKDAERVRFLISNGWKVLQIMTWEIFPEKEKVFRCLARLQRGDCKWIQLKCADWGGKNGTK